MDVNRRELLHGIIVAGGSGLAGCNQDTGSEPDGLAGVEFTNNDTTGHTMEITLSGECFEVDRTLSLPPPTVASDGEQSPVTKSIFDFPDQAGEYVLTWSIDGGSQTQHEVEDISACEVMQVEIDDNAGVSISMHASIDCYGQDPTPCPY